MFLYRSFAVEISKFAPKERIKYEYEMRTERDLRNQMAYSRKEGFLEGVEKGKAEGLAEGRAEGEEMVSLIARRLAERGFSPEEIKELTRFEPK